MNVLISGEHRALLTDFGLSIVMNEIRNLSTYSNEMQSKPRGTMAWMAPEVHRGSRPDKASDIYSLGMTIWEIYSDQTPFSGTRLEVLSRVVTSGTRPDRPGRLNDDKVWAVVRRCWSNNAKSRPTADQVVNLLNSPNSDGVSNLNGKYTFVHRCTLSILTIIIPVNEVDMGLLASDPPTENSWNWNSDVTANNSIGNSIGTRTTKSHPWQAEESSDEIDSSSPDTAESTVDPKDQIWMDIIQNLPPQWEHVPWGGNMYVNSTTIPFVPSDKQYTYRIVKDH
ncbi:hypothetical protein HYPSUDRAFT_278504 [Hypholoma sublateritium FD-334 SS-4]|uniref:Protein kinase domain-containing protein n=1 Tax=Hypholoma sublateritium (strain FD-334 SS-4) TaxID=945553 RepID=A0A0D2LG19_HYPSF|nr:hypothetical protein HYPSUDRAFT_278504 [Hypholoma sublateritium FD-334 SS-4]